MDYTISYEKSHDRGKTIVVQSDSKWQGATQILKFLFCKYSADEQYEWSQSWKTYLEYSFM